jgi:hypothetical protein
VLLAAVFARGALTAAVDKDANTDEVTNLEFLDGCANFGDAPDNFVTRHNWVRLGAPVTIDSVDVGVADALELNIDAHILRADITAKNGVRAKVGRGVKCGVGACGVAHKPMLLLGSTQTFVGILE